MQSSPTIVPPWDAPMDWGGGNSRAEDLLAPTETPYCIQTPRATLDQMPTTRSEALDKLKSRVAQRQATILASKSTQNPKHKRGTVAPMPPLAGSTETPRVLTNINRGGSPALSRDEGHGTCTPECGRKPFLKRRDRGVPAVSAGGPLPDWSAVRPKTQSRLDPNLILNKPKCHKAKENKVQQSLGGNLARGPPSHGWHTGRRKGWPSKHPAALLSPPVSVGPMRRARRNLYEAIGGKESALEEMMFEDPLAPLMSQVERLLISMEQATRQLK